MAACVICNEVSGRWLCVKCGRSYDRHNAKDGTTAGLIKWAANRTRKLLTPTKAVRR